MSETSEITREIKTEARRLGFSLAGVCPAEPSPNLARLHAWLDAGYAGQMHYFAERRQAYEHPRHVLDGVRSIVMLAMNYRTAEPEPAAPGCGNVSRYAWGAIDYHDLIHDRLKQLAAFIQQRKPEAQVRGVVDTAPLLERDFAQLAGLGWIGKNTMLLNRQLGSWFFLAALLTDLDLPCDAPYPTDHCGTCRACLDACPTGAFPEPYLLDATRCISYLTIERRNAIAPQQREGVGDWLFGCDVCQQVCPWNRKSPATDEAAFAPAEGMNPVQAAELLAMDEEEFRRRFRQTPLWRPRRRGLLRNAAIVLGNARDPAAIDALIAGLRDEDPIVREACAWALSRYDDPRAAAALVEL